MNIPWGPGGGTRRKPHCHREAAQPKPSWASQGSVRSGAREGHQAYAKGPRRTPLTRPRQRDPGYVRRPTLTEEGETRTLDPT